jgi:hypothetical protein
MDQAERDRRQKAALEWINTRWTNPDKRCPICSQSNWGVGAVYELREYEDGNLVLGGNSGILPAFPVTCATCGHTYWFNALSAGIIGGAPEPKQPPDGSGDPQ